MAEDRKHSHKLSRLMCCCPPWWKPNKSEPSLWYISAGAGSWNLNTMMELESDDDGIHKWELSRNHGYKYGEPTSMVPSLRRKVKNTPQGFKCVKVLNYKSDIDYMCTYYHGCCANNDTFCSSYYQDDFSRMFESREQLHAELLARLWNPQRLLAMDT